MKDNIHPLYGFTTQNINLISHEKKEPAWILKKRRLAYLSFCDKKFPEDYPEFSTLDLASLKIYLAARGKNISKPREDAFGYLLQSESTVQASHLNYQARKNRVLFTSISVALVKHSEIFRRNFDHFPNHQDWIFNDMNSAIFSDGAFLFVPENLKCSMPFIILSKIFSRGLSQFKRNLFVCGAASDSRIIFRGEAGEWDDASNLSCETTEIIVERHAHCILLIDQKWLGNIWNFHTIKCEVREGGNLEVEINNTDAKLSMIDLHVHLKNEGAKCRVKSISCGKNTEKRNYRFRIFHEAAKTSSRLDLLNFSKDDSHLHQYSYVAVGSAAINSESDVNCVNMVFDQKSQIKTEEECVIKNTSSKINKIVQYVFLTPQQINYLKSRGMEQAHIENLLVKQTKKKLIW